MFKMHCYAAINRSVSLCLPNGIHTDFNVAKLEHINFKQLCKKKKPIKRPPTLITFDGSIPRSVISGDGELLVIHYPNAVSASANVSNPTASILFISHLPLNYRMSSVVRSSRTRPPIPQRPTLLEPPWGNPESTSKFLVSGTGKPGCLAITMPLGER